ncbi:hypothetical protein [Microbacterium sp. WCS2018Hpa-9]|uniref:hypothetical protein n=1 Tax=Microbacterium sp. WCS2018Hpa-9 TaxID=3073635 RepID=UPI0028894CE6|nr:hypothetical protein [Microbacterium sp. WCS2018Hpa-9]
MTRVAGRNVVISWIAAVLCIGVVGTLIWFSMPIVPVVASFVGDMLRSTLR